MKLQNELDNTIKVFGEHKEIILDHATWLKEHASYNDFETRLAWDCLRAFIKTSTICEWYEKYNCNDKNITTLGKKALKTLNII